jgi:hypothetical protein
MAVFRQPGVIQGDIIREQMQVRSGPWPWKEWWRPQDHFRVLAAQAATEAKATSVVASLVMGAATMRRKGIGP